MLSNVEVRGQHPRVGGHDRAGGDRSRVVHVAHVPQIGVLAADPLEVGSDAARAPLEWVIVDELSGLGVLAVALGLGADRAHHLRVAVVAALGEVDVAAGELERRVGRHRGDGRHVGFDEEGGDDLEERSHHHRNDHRDGELQRQPLPAPVPRWSRRSVRACRRY